MGYVYVVTDGDILENEQGLLTKTETVKIGYTANDVYNRISQLQVGNPRKISLVYLYRFETPEMAKQAEKMCHRSLSGSEASGEWFYYGETVAAVLKALETFAVFESSTAPDEESYKAYNAKVLAVANG